MNKPRTPSFAPRIRSGKNRMKRRHVTAVVAFLYPYDADSATSTATVVVNDVDETLNKLLL